MLSFAYWMLGSSLVNLMICQVSGRHAVVQAVGTLFPNDFRISSCSCKLQHDMEKDERRFEFNYKDDIYAVASLLKVFVQSYHGLSLLNSTQLYLRELPEPVFRFPLQERMQHTEDIGTLSRVQIYTSILNHL
jgi:hypothetical protein